MDIKWTEKRIRELLLASDKMVIRSLLVLYQRQTDNEKLKQHNNEVNGMGFNQYDAPILTDFCSKLKGGYYLTDKQIKIARKRLLKYVKQLTKIANGVL